MRQKQVKTTSSLLIKTHYVSVQTTSERNYFDLDGDDDDLASTAPPVEVRRPTFLSQLPPPTPSVKPPLPANLKEAKPR